MEALCRPPLPGEEGSRKALIIGDRRSPYRRVALDERIFFLFLVCQKWVHRNTRSSWTMRNTAIPAIRPVAFRHTFNIGDQNGFGVTI